jgi:hypothetical protein
LFFDLEFALYSKLAQCSCAYNKLEALYST